MTESEKKIDTLDKIQEAIALLGKCGITLNELGENINKAFFFKRCCKK